MIKTFHYAICFLILLCVSASLRLTTPAQVRPIYDRGATGLGQMLKRLNTTASALMIGAHPDDEDTALLTYLARGESARTAYLSLTRGDGGQNIIGPELGEGLGVIRTEELLQARRLDGAEQYFTRAYDYGFSKTLDEAKSKWDEKVLLCDVVRVIRSYRPLVVISQFTGTSADGHGQHQFAGYISPLAVKAAADASQCDGGGAAWQVKKFYVRHGFRATGEPQLKINTGKYDPLLGRSYFEIAMEARSQHKSQEQGVLELKGEQFSGLNLIEGQVSNLQKELGVFDGIDVSLAGIPETFGEKGKAVDERTKQNLSGIQNSAEQALKQFDPGRPQLLLPILTRGLKAARALGGGLHNYSDFVNVAAEKWFEFDEAVKLAAGIQIDALADKENVAPGEEFVVNVKVFFSSPENVKVKVIYLNTPKDWQIQTPQPSKTETQLSFRREVANEAALFKIRIPLSTKPTQPYWLDEKRDDNLYRWKRMENENLSFAPPQFSATVAVIIHETEIYFSHEHVQFRFADDIRGEIRRNIDVVPELSVSLDQKLLIVSQSEKAQTKRVVMSIMNNSSKQISGSAGLNIVGLKKLDWRYSTDKPTFDLKKGEKTTVSFDVEIPAKTKAGSYHFYAQAMVGEALATQEMNVIAYPHIQTHRYYRPATVDVQVIDLKTARSKVGYIVGSGDRVPEAIRQMGFDMEIVSERDLASGDLSRFDVIVVGIRAYQVRGDIVANNQRLLDYARNGGTLIVQYQLPGFAQQNLMPYPAQMGPRVADENAKVTILQPEHPIFNFPNKITDADFAGWVQEQNLYNFSTMDVAYKPLLESHDAGEQENKGGLVIAKVGKGNWVYCSYSLFRQLPAGVPGAYRLFANLLSLPEAGKK